jgi:uncharacterized membrane protein YgcG
MPSPAAPKPYHKPLHSCHLRSLWYELRSLVGQHGEKNLATQKERHPRATRTHTHTHPPFSLILCVWGYIMFVGACIQCCVSTHVLLVRCTTPSETQGRLQHGSRLIVFAQGLTRVESSSLAAHAGPTVACFVVTRGLLCDCDEKPRSDRYTTCLVLL